MLLAGRRLLVVGENEDLAREVAAAAAPQGAEVVACRGGREALARLDAGGVDAVLVDLPLADLRGDVFLVALRDRALPCVAVSGVLRGARYELLARQFGVLAFLEKPFRMELALGPIAQALPDPLPAAAPGAPPQALEDAPSDPDSLIYSPARPALDETLPGVPLFTAPAQGLDLPLPSATPPPIPLPRDAPALPEGSLEHTTVPKVLVALHAAQATGALTLTRGAVKKVILVEGGHPVLATSNLAAERFGARCVAEGLLTREEHAELVARLGPSASLGEALVASGRLDEAERARRVTAQVREIIWSTFGWRDGAYRLALGALPRRRRVPLDLALGDLVLEGHRRASALEVLRAGLPERLALAPRADGPFPLHELALSPAEASLLTHADGTKTVRDLVLLSRVPEREALAFLQGCRELGLVDEVSRVLAGTRRIGFM